MESTGQIGGPGMDADISKMVHRILAKQGMKFKLNSTVLGGVTSSSEKVRIKIKGAQGDSSEELGADVVLVAIGRRAYTHGLGLENIGLDTDERGRIIIDQEYRTKYPNIRVIGDVTFGAMLAHKVIFLRYLI